MVKPLRHVLAIGVDGDHLAHIAPVLKRSQLEVVTVDDDPYVLDLIRGTPFDLLVVTYPPSTMTTETLLEAVRGEGSSSQRAGLILLAVPGTLDAALAYIDQGANRAVAVNWAAARLWQAVVDLLEVSPRIRVRFPVQFDLELPGVPSGAAVETENLSLSGMAIRSRRTIPLGTRLPLRVYLPTELDPIGATAEVVRASDPDREGFNGFGLRFVRFQDDSEKRLATALQAMQAS
jgi:hypothetical protein